MGRWGTRAGPGCASRTLWKRRVSWTASKESKNGTVHSFVHRAWKTGDRTPVFHSINRPAALRRASLGLSLSKRRNNTIDRIRRWRHNQPVHSIGAGSVQLVRVLSGTAVRRESVTIDDVAPIGAPARANQRAQGPEDGDEKWRARRDSALIPGPIAADRMPTSMSDLILARHSRFASPTDAAQGFLGRAQDRAAPLRKG